MTHLRQIAHRLAVVTVLVAAAVLPAAPGIGAQETGKGPRVGVLNAAGGAQAILDPFYRGLRDLGWIEGRNMVIERRSAEGYEEQLPGLAADLVRLKVDVIVAAGGPASLNAARAATKTIPIVMIASSSDPVAAGIAQSLARPGGNVTGLASYPEELSGKRLSILKEAVPKLSRVGVLWDANVGPYRLSKSTEEAARSLDVEVLPFEIRGPGDIEAAVTAAAKARVGALIISSTPMTGRNRAQVIEVVTRHRLPAIAVWSPWPESGLLMAYGPSLLEEFGRAAVYVDKILKGAKPGDLPIEQPTRFELVINLKAAKAIGLAVPQLLLLRADRVIQ